MWRFWFQNSLYRVVYCITAPITPPATPAPGFRTRSIESFTASQVMGKVRSLPKEFQNSLYRVVYCIPLVGQPLTAAFLWVSELALSSRLLHLLSSFTGGQGPTSFRTRSIESFTASTATPIAPSLVSGFRTRSIESFTASTCVTPAIAPLYNVSELALSSRLLHQALLGQRWRDSSRFRTRSIESFTASHWWSTARCCNHNVSELALSSRLLHPDAAQLLALCHQCFRTRSIESFTASRPRASFQVLVPTVSELALSSRLLHPGFRFSLTACRARFRTRSIESFTASDIDAQCPVVDIMFQNSLYRVVYCIDITLEDAQRIV